jgi:hypothetical protein
MVMDEATARELLDMERILHDYCLDNVKAAAYVSWSPGDSNACIDGYFTADQLEAMAWWMRQSWVEPPLGGGTHKGEHG